MTLKDFDWVNEMAHQAKVAGEKMFALGRQLEDQAMLIAGIEQVSREPGFASWTFDGGQGFYNTPREALAAKLEMEQSKSGGNQ